MNLSEVIKFPDNVQGLDVEAIIDTIWEIKTLPGIGGKTFSVQNITVYDIGDPEIRCNVGVNKNLIDPDKMTYSLKGIKATFSKCKKGSYTNSRGEVVPKLTCSGGWFTNDVKESKNTETVNDKENKEVKQEPAKPIQRTNPIEDKMSKEDWKQVNLQISRQSSLERAVDLVTCLINNKMFDTTQDPFLYAQMKAEDNVRYVYKGTAQQDNELDKRNKRIELINKAKEKYGINDENLISEIKTISDKEDITTMDYTQLGDLLNKLVEIGIQDPEVGEFKDDKDIPF